MKRGETGVNSAHVHLTKCFFQSIHCSRSMFLMLILLSWDDLVMCRKHLAVLEKCWVNFASAGHPADPILGLLKGEALKSCITLTGSEVCSCCWNTTQGRRRWADTGIRRCTDCYSLSDCISIRAARPPPALGCAHKPQTEYQGGLSGVLLVHMWRETAVVTWNFWF